MTVAPSSLITRSWAPEVASSVDDDEIVFDGVQCIRTGLGCDHDVLEPRAPLALEVDAGLDRERMTGNECFAISTDDVRILVLFDTDAVTGSVDELGPVAAVSDDAARDGVNVFARSADRRGRDRLLLGIQQHGVQVTELARRFHAARPHATRDVRAVADAVVAEHRAAEVAQHHLARTDPALGGVVMRARGVRT